MIYILCDSKYHVFARQVQVRPAIALSSLRYHGSLPTPHSHPGNTSGLAWLLIVSPCHYCLCLSLYSHQIQRGIISAEPPTKTHLGNHHIQSVIQTHAPIPQRSALVQEAGDACVAGKPSGAPRTSPLLVGLSFAHLRGGGSFGGSFFFPMSCSFGCSNVGNGGTAIGTPCRCFGTSGRERCAFRVLLGFGTIGGLPAVFKSGFSSVSGFCFRLGVVTPGFSVTSATTLTLLALCDLERLPRSSVCGDSGSISSPSASHGVFATRSTRRRVVGSGGVKWTLPEPRSISRRLSTWSRL